MCAYFAKANIITIDLKSENNFILTPQELEAAITPKTKLLILPYPNNPTGAIMPKENLNGIVKQDKDIIVISDRFIRS